jgi:hypothetical protein
MVMRAAVAASIRSGISSYGDCPSDSRMMCFLARARGQQLVDRLAQARQDVGAAAGGDARDVAQDALPVGGALQAHHRVGGAVEHDHRRSGRRRQRLGGGAGCLLGQLHLGAAIDPERSITSASASVASSRRSGMSSRTGSIDSERVVAM